MKVWENSKKLWKHSPAARVPTAFLVLPNFHSCLYNSIETRYMFSISQLLKYASSSSMICRCVLKHAHESKSISRQILITCKIHCSLTDENRSLSLCLLGNHSSLVKRMVTSTLTALEKLQFRKRSNYDLRGTSTAQSVHYNSTKKNTTDNN